MALEVLTARRPEDAGNLQAWARDVRLGTGARMATALGARLATGHTATDQAETDPLPARRLARPPRAARHGRARRAARAPAAAGDARARPPRTARRAGCAWREDASNDDPAYARNRARAGLVPALRELHPAAERNVVRTAELLREEAAVLDEVVATALAGRDRIEVAHLARAAAGARAARRAAARRGRRRPAVRPRRRRAWPTSSRSATARSTSATAPARSSRAACCASSRRRPAGRRPQPATA